MAACPRVPFVIVMLSLAATALAGESAPAPRIFTSSDTVQVIGERPGTDALDAPVATVVVPAAAWQSSRTAGLEAALAEVPGVLAVSRAGATDVRITSRGFGARGAGERSNAGTTRGLRITLDGFPVTEPDGRTSLDLADPALLERVRVVRSNSSALYGPASGGLIELQGAVPFADPYGEARAEFGSFGYAKQVLDTGFLSGDAQVRTAFSTTVWDGWRAHSRGTQSTLFASVLSQPSPATKLGVYLAGTHNVQRQPGALTLAEYEADPRQANPSYVTQDARRDNTLGRLGARVEHVFGGGQTLQVGAFVEPKTLHRSERGRWRDFQRTHVGGTAVAGGPLGDGLRWSAGADGVLQDGSVLFYDLVDGERGPTQVADQREGISDVGAFGELAWTPSPRWQATAGGRWDNVHYVSEDHQDASVDASRSLHRLSPRVALSFRPSARQLFFAALSAGIETPAFNEVDPPPDVPATSLNPLLEPSHSLTLEVGTRGERFGDGFLRRLGYDVALYTLDVDNDIVPWDGGAWYLTAGKSRRRGCELGLGADFPAGFSARLTGNFTHNRYLDYTTGSLEEPLDYAGHESAGIPATTVQASLRWTSPRGAWAELGARRVGAYWANDANTDRVGSSTVLDATAGLDTRLGSCEAQLFASVRNLGDELYAASVYINGAGGRYLEPGLGRNVVAGVTLRPW